MRAKDMARSKKDVSVVSVENESLTDLPAGIIGESSNLHAMRGAARPGRSVAVLGVSAAAARLLTVARAAGELDRQAFTHEVGSILLCASGLARDSIARERGRVCWAGGGWGCSAWVSESQDRT